MNNDNVIVRVNERIVLVIQRYMLLKRCAVDKVAPIKKQENHIYCIDYKMLHLDIFQ